MQARSVVSSVQSRPPFDRLASPWAVGERGHGKEECVRTLRLSSRELGDQLDFHQRSQPREGSAAKLRFLGCSPTTTSSHVCSTSTAAEGYFCFTAHLETGTTGSPPSPSSHRKALLHRGPSVGSQLGDFGRFSTKDCTGRECCSHTHSRAPQWPTDELVRRVFRSLLLAVVAGRSQRSSRP